MNSNKKSLGLAIKLALGIGLLSLGSNIAAKNYLLSADGRAVAVKPAVTQPDISMYRSPIESKIIDRQVYTNEATFMANEEYKMGMEGWNDMVKAGLPVSYRRAFQWVVMRENYMYARNLLDYMGGRTHSGIHMVQGPYWTMKAERHTNYNRLQRDRGERTFSNKDTMLGFYLPLVYQRTGFPRVFDDIQLSYLQYQSVDPRFTGKLDPTDSFDDPISGKKGGWGTRNTYFNDYAQRFDHDKMDTTFHMGAIGQFVKRRSQWVDHFFEAERTDEHEASRQLVSLLGNDAEEGMRGWGLASGAINAILQVKSAMFYDGKSLGGINPKTYNPKKGLRYIPHAITPDILWAGDAPERLTGMSVADDSSQLWDQASWIWGSSGFAMAVHQRTKVFTANPPVDGGLFEKGVGTMSSSLGASVFKNIKAMHVRNGIFVSQWTPKGKTGKTIELKDMMMIMVALHDQEQIWKVLGIYKGLRQDALALIKTNAEFLVKAQNANGSFSSSYSTDAKSKGENNLSVSNWEAIRALKAAYDSTQDSRFIKAARKAFNYNNNTFWVEKDGVYRTRLKDNNVVVTPYSTGVTIAAMREMLYSTPAHMVNAQIERLTRWWIQTVDQSGLMQAETHLTGEIFGGFGSSDDDADGIPYVSKGYGKNGTAPLMAGKVVINVGGNLNTHFKNLKGDLHNPNKFSKVVMRYNSSKQDVQADINIPLDIQKTSEFVDRKIMIRQDGSSMPLPAGIPEKTVLASKYNLGGKQIFEANCQICHGQFGEGIDGKNLGNMMYFNYESMFHVVQNGRFEISMPPWGAGNADDFGGVLKKPEIDKIIAYVQSDDFRKPHNDSEEGKVVKNALPRDVWFYLSRDNIKNNGKIISGQKEADKYIKAQSDPRTLKATWWENLRLEKGIK